MEEDHFYVYLDFNEKLKSELFQKKLFLRIANLHQKNPLVQINDHVFKGSYEHCVGNNLFFKVNHDQFQETSSFEKTIPVSLEHIVTQFNVLNLKQVLINRSKISIPEYSENIKLNLKKNYNTLLDQLENNTLKFDDTSDVDVENKSTDIEEDELMSSDELTVKGEEQEPSYIEPDLDVKSPSTSTSNKKKANYDKLKLLASTPVRRLCKDEVMFTCDSEYKIKLDYSETERQILQPTLDEQRNINDEKTVTKYLESLKQTFACWSESQKNSKMNLEDFETLPLVYRYCFLKEHLENLKRYIKTAEKNELLVKDQYGHTPVQNYEFCEKLIDSLENKIKSANCENAQNDGA